MKALINAAVYDFKSFHENAYVLFDSKIVEIGDMKDFKGADIVHDCRGCLVMPGLVNCHTHIYSTFSRGMNIPFNPKSFTDILNQLWWKLDSKLDREAVYLSGLVYGIDCIKSGVTSIIDHHASGLIIKGSLNELKRAICDDLYLRGIFCFETSDRFNVDECIDENLEFSREKTERCRGLFGMHASMSLSDETLKKISKSLSGNPIHIHVAESIDDVSDCREKHGKKIIKRLDEFNLLNRDSILGHCVHIDEEEAELIKERGCRVVLNPTSNMNNAVGLADYKMLREKGIKCMIGNDGLGANITRDYLNIVFGMKHRLKSPVEFSLSDLTELINNGYEYIGKMLDVKIGRIEEGYAADMIAVPYNPPTPMDEGNIMGHIFFGVFDSFTPRDVWISGQCLMKDYNLSFDVSGLYEKTKADARKVWDRIKKG